MSEFAPGSEHDFSAVVQIIDGNDAAAVQKASAMAQATQDYWGRDCPKMVAAMVFRSGYEVYEERGRGWFVRFTQSIRLYTLEESTTLPGDWTGRRDESS